MTLTDFLLARIAEDEERMAASICDCLSPRRMLAECAAKRRMVERLEYALSENSKMPQGFAANEIFGLLQAVGFIALPYADHPDYRERWKP